MTQAYRRRDQEALQTPKDHYRRLHSEAHGVVLVWERLAGGNRWVKLHPQSESIPAILTGQEGGEDRFISVNQFHSWRVVRQLKSLRTCYVDIDGCTHLSWVLEAVANALLPSPTMAVMSGRGLHLYWQIDAVPAQALPVWQRLQVEISERLAREGVPVDMRARDCTRVLRLVGSRHSATGEDVRGVVLQEARWTLHELADEVLGHRQQQEQPRRMAEVRSLDAARVRAGRQPRTAGGSIYDWWRLVYEDVLRIGDANLLGLPEGHRDAWLFLYAVSLSWFAGPEALAAEVEAVARNYTPGLSAAEVRKAVAPTLQRAEAAQRGERISWAGQERDPRYWFKRETLLKWLAPVIPSDLYPELRAIVPDELRQERRTQQNRARWADHNTGQGYRQGNEQKRATARLMRTQGASLRAIATAVGKGYETVREWCRDVIPGG